MVVHILPARNSKGLLTRDINLEEMSFTIERQFDQTVNLTF